MFRLKFIVVNIPHKVITMTTITTRILWKSRCAARTSTSRLQSTRNDCVSYTIL